MKKKMMAIGIVAVTLSIVSCNKEEPVLQELKSSEVTYGYGAQESYVLTPDMVENKEVTLVFDYHFYGDVFNQLDHKYFGKANGVDIYGRLKNFNLKQFWIGDFMLRDEEIFKAGETFSTIFESAMLTFDFEQESRILAIQNSLSEGENYDQLDFTVQPFDLVDVLDKGVLSLHLKLKENPTEIRYFDFSFSIGCLVDGIYVKE